MFSIKIPEGRLINFEQDLSFENFIGQFQVFCPTKLLCIVDGTSLRFYDRPGTIPVNIRFDYKQRRGKFIEYYFRDIENDSLYCVFGREAAKIFYPRIDDVDPIKSLRESGAPARISNTESKSGNNQNYDMKHPINNIISRKSLPEIKTQTNGKNIPDPGDINEIIIIDKGVRLVFPSTNYPLEICTHNPRVT